MTCIPHHRRKMKFTVEGKISKQSVIEKFKKQLVNGKTDFFYSGFILLTNHEYEDINKLLADDREWFDVFPDKETAIQEANLTSESVVLFKLLFNSSATADSRLAATRNGHICNDRICIFDFEAWSLQEIPVTNK